MNRKGFAPILVLLIVAGVLIVGGTWYATHQAKLQPQVQQSQNIPPIQTNPPHNLPTSSTTNSLTAIASSTSAWKNYRNEQYGFMFSLPSTWTSSDAWKGGFQIDGAISFDNFNAHYDNGAIPPGSASIDISSDFLPPSLDNYIAHELHNGVITSTSTLAVANMSCTQVFYTDIFNGDLFTNTTTTITYHRIGVYCPTNNLLYKFYFSQRANNSEQLSIDIFHQFLSTFNFISGINYTKPRSGVIKSAYIKNDSRFVDVNYLRFLMGSDAERVMQADGCFGLNNSTTSDPCSPLDGYITADWQKSTTTLQVSDSVQIFDPHHQSIQFDTLVSPNPLINDPYSYTYWWFKQNSNGVVMEIDQQYTP